MNKFLLVAAVATLLTLLDSRHNNHVAEAMAADHASRNPRQVSFAGTVDDILDSALVVDAPFDDPYGEDDDELTRNFANFGRPHYPANGNNHGAFLPANNRPIAVLPSLPSSPSFNFPSAYPYPYNSTGFFGFNNTEYFNNGFLNAMLSGYYGFPNTTAAPTTTTTTTKATTTTPRYGGNFYAFFFRDAEEAAAAEAAEAAAAAAAADPFYYFEQQGGVVPPYFGRRR